MEDYKTALTDEPMPRIELGTSSLPRKRSTTELHRLVIFFERETGFEPATFSLEGWRSTNWATPAIGLVGRAGFEPAKVKPTDLQSVLVGRLSISPKSEPMEGLEPTTCWLQISCSSQLSYIGLCSYLWAVANVTINLVGFKKIKRHFDKNVIAFLYS